MADTEVSVEISATGNAAAAVASITQELKNLAAQAAQARAGISGIGTTGATAMPPVAAGAAKADDAIQSMGDSTKESTNALQGMLQAAIAYLSVSAVTEFTDKWKNIQARIDLVSKSSSEFAQNLKNVATIANDTFTDLEATTNLYTTISRVTKDSSDNIA